MTNKSIGGTDVADGNAGGPDLYRTGCRDGRGVVEAAGLIVDARRRRSGKFGPNDRRPDTAYTKRKAACVATSGPSLGRKRPKEGSDSGSEGTVATA